jgi:hypothetical protein
MADSRRNSDARMTVRLNPATRRKLERLAQREGISLNEAVNRLLQQAPERSEPAAGRRRYRLKPRDQGFGFDISRAKELAGATSDEQVLRKLKGRG